MLAIIFWILISIILYTYAGYAVLLAVLLGIKRCFVSKTIYKSDESLLPEVTIFIAAYNEKDIIEQKIKNTLQLDYPSDKIKIVWITDGSNDGTPDILRSYEGLTVLHQEGRSGKTAALNRGMDYINTPYVVYCDANTILHKDSIRNLITHFDSEKVGCVAGEKRISGEFYDKASGAGEGAYWKYEAIIKQLESEIYSTLGAAGELYAIRTDLFEKVDNDIIVDDFVNSLQIALKGYRIKYSPEAYAIESPSFNIKEELKRKIRIASGGFQVISRMPQLLNIFKYGFLSFEFLSHKVFRWAVVPVSLPLVLLLNGWLCIVRDFQDPLYNLLFAAQVLFYLLAIAGGNIKKRTGLLRFLYLPYYLVVINYAQIAGLLRFLRRKHTVVWEKARRS